ncbi:G-D-S-L family lipolytic protein [Christiangramia sp. SM2212]|uniref:G-D-S-L family lipolytic protein n=1 Tax=Christiangramia sediminicola TaxID=3073267 RepID=A0ABU1EM43_9FLAO|nr:G-D-S-L family lipolytic protein [Christiangramia sp. SM2212]MDR5589416.1 G-D-S-L family lipolytic protein [Christiangramia sp. SM2212]
MKNYFKYIAILALGVVSCEPELDNPIEDGNVYSNGEADFSNYVALGNSLTAGYADGSLYITGQENSYPNILASKFALTQETMDFTQPLVNDNVGGLLLGGNQIAEPRFVLAGESLATARPARYNGTPTTEVSNKLSGPFGNMGVPGAKSYHLLAPGYGSVAGVATGAANPYFARFASSETTTVLADAIAQNPTFFTLWIGNNDVLSYATSGGVGVYQENVTDFTQYGPNDITDANAFAFVYNSLVSQLAGESGLGAEGVLINIPNVTDIPFFNVVPVNPIPLDAATAGALNAQFGAYNTQILPGLVQAGLLTEAEANSRKITFAESSQNFVTLVDEDLTDISGVLQQPPFSLDAQTAGLLGQLRQATPSDLIPLTSASFIGTTVNNNPMLVNGVSVPLSDQHVLTASEQALVAQVTAQYNGAIASIAQNYSLGLVDANSLLATIGADGGTLYDGVPVSSAFVTGGAFSLDGVHLTPRGYAVIANEIVNEINATYSADVPGVDVGSYGTVTINNNVQ